MSPADSRSYGLCRDASQWAECSDEVLRRLALARMVCNWHQIDFLLMANPPQTDPRYVRPADRAGTPLDHRRTRG